MTATTAGTWRGSPDWLTRFRSSTSRSTSRVRSTSTTGSRPGSRPSANVAQHVRHATHDEDSAVPVIPGPDNRVMDGLHRIARAVLDNPSRVRAVPPERLPAPAHVTWRSAVWELLRPLHADAPGPELAAAGTSKNAHRDNGCLGQPGAVLPFAADAALPESSVRPAEAVVAEQNAAMRRGGAAQA